MSHSPPRDTEPVRSRSDSETFECTAPDAIQHLANSGFEGLDSGMESTCFESLVEFLYDLTAVSVTETGGDRGRVEVEELDHPIVVVAIPDSTEAVTVHDARRVRESVDDPVLLVTTGSITDGARRHIEAETDFDYAVLDSLVSITAE